MFELPCVIFAGGKSSRMGEDKALLPFGTYNTLTEFQYHRLKKIFKDVFISCKSKEKFSFDAPFIEDIPTSQAFAPTAGFVASFHALTSQAFFAISVDAPFIDEKIIATLIQSDKEAWDVDATIARSSHGMEPMCGIYHRSLQGEFEKMLQEDNHKLGFLLKNVKTNFVSFEESQPFSNLNHPHEYKEALKFLKNS
ncbi:MAG: molybdenum cofactor guanylyltransferase MobA [Sulfurimonas sp.]|jgi:molybdopterin-guanine dinucleotide biosynthesis protein A|nr:molybdenum cofactor guanylyltransferase MobA [Sulfurimonas sp.]